MEDLLTFVLNNENIRAIILLVVIVGGFLLQNAKIDKRFTEMDAKMDKGFLEVDKRFVEVDKRFVELESEFKADIAATEARLNARIDMLKFNDFAHLNNAFKNLTYTLEQKQLINADDKAFIDKALEE
jgi:hypothetical protein